MSVLGILGNLPAAAMNIFTPQAKKASIASQAATAGQGTNAAASTGTTSSATTNIGTTFLNLLVKELQNQDPTAPMDSTAMVGQMISLNQLDQLTSINQILSAGSSSTGSTGTAGTSTTGSVAGANGSSASAVAARSALLQDSSSLLSSQQVSAQSISGSTAFSPDPLNSAASSSSGAGALNLSNFNSILGAK